ncbi:ATP-dependent acyl-CoA ligase [Cupriavidus lacunae]|uniref:ATP-dependent acyl-CoA ligase n=1 Tax=Cupriavidus lacunae TaxID=2666307 RepID=A0A370NHQ1_9BURK|nr:ATP-dependent acyl-CoA ligase [Cupriavidus lacunae]RDK05104.1 ATP-dependent acyl-CoA ligase [Cupriavidus lacunae]
MQATIDIGTVFGEIRDWTMSAILARRAALSADQLFLRDMPDGRSYTYSELERETNGLAHAFRDMGIGYRDHVAVMFENCPEQVLSYFSLGKAGAVSVPINTAAKGQLLRYYLDHADCSSVVVSEALVEEVVQVAGDLPGLSRLIILGDTQPTRARLAGTGIDVQAFPRDCASDAPFDSPARFNDLAYLLYTSGTTGPSKAIMLTHACTHFWGEQTIRFRHVQAGDVEYVYLPLFHANALLIGVTTALMAGTTVALARRFSAGRFWSDVRAAGVTRFSSIGAVANFLYAQPPGPGDRDHQVRVCTLAPVPAFVHGFEARFGLRVLSGYALSDYCAATWRPLDTPSEKYFSAGLPRDTVSVRVVDDDDFDVPAGSPGEILLRVEQPWATPLGYYKMPEATVAAHLNGWFHTGDRGYFDADGYLYFTDRKKDAIRRRGENISAYEVETIMQTHPAIRQVAVYPVRSEFTEDEVAATVILHEGQTLSCEALIGYCSANMSKFMVPRFVEFVDELPLTLTNKVEKYKLRQRAEADLTRLWDRDGHR